MSTKTTFKRIALVTVATLGAGVLSVAPAHAADSAAVVAIVSNQTTVRTDDTVYDDTVGGTGTAFGIKSTEAAANDFLGAKVKVTYQANSTASEVIISTVASGGAPAAAASDTITLGTGVALEFDNGAAGTNTWGTPTSGVYTVAGADASTGTNVIKLNFGRNATPGLYKLWIDGNADGDWTDATGTDDTGTFMIADMPNSVSLTNSITDTSAGSRVGDGTATYYAKVKDAGGRESYLLGTERVRFAVSGGSGTGVTVTTPALPTIGAGDLTTTATNRYYSVVATAATAAGTYTITGTPEGFASTWATTAGTATLAITSTTSVAESATKLEITSAGVNSSAGTFDDGSTADTTAAAAKAQATVDTKAEVIALATTVVAWNYLPTTQRDITVKASFATTVTGDAKFTVTYSNISGIKTDTEVVAPIVTGATANTASYTFKADYANADEFVVVKVAATAAAATVLEVAAIYANPTPGKVTISPDAANIRVTAASTTTLTAKVVDQFGYVMSNQGVTLATSAGSRNASITQSANTDSSGVATFSLKDAYTGTALTTDAITVTTVNNAKTDTINLVYGAVTTGKVSLAVTQPTTPGTTATYATAITTATAPTVTVDDTPDSTSNSSDALDIADQVNVVATITDAPGATIQGQKVTVTGTNGIFFKNSATLGDVDLKVASRLSTIDAYTDAAGQITFQAAFTKSGTATITVTSGSVSKTYSIDVSAGTARNISVSNSNGAVTTTVTDAWGNGVAKAISVSASGVGRFSNGVAYNSPTTNSDGVVVYDVVGAAAGTTTITSEMTADATNKALADADYGFKAGNYKATVDVKVAASVTNSINAQIASLLAKINALAKLIAKIQKKLGVK